MACNTKSESTLKTTSLEVTKMERDKIMLKIRLAQKQSYVQVQIQTLKLRCGLCGNNYYNDEVKISSASLFGHYRYAICPLCGSEISDDMWTHSYKIKWTRGWKKAVCNILGSSSSEDQKRFFKTHFPTKRQR